PERHTAPADAARNWRRETVMGGDLGWWVRTRVTSAKLCPATVGVKRRGSCTRPGMAIADPTTRGRLEETWATVNGLRTFARVADGPAAAPAVVLVHGVGVSGLYMVPLAERLAANFR